MDKITKSQRGAQNESIWLVSLISGLIGLGAMLTSALIFPLIIVRTDNPNSLVLPAALICAALGGFLGGFISARRSKGAEFISAFISIAAILLPLLLISFVYEKGFSFIDFGIIAVVIIGFGLIGALLAGKSAGNKKRNMKKLMKKPR